MNDRQAECAATLHDATRLVDRPWHVVNVLKRHEGNGEVRGAIVERQPGRIGNDDLHRRVGGFCELDHGRRDIDRHHVVAERP
jgi:hypothetical protein